MTKVTANGSNTTTKIRINHFTTRLTALSKASLIKTGFSVASAACTSESNARATNLNEPMSVALIFPSSSRILDSASSFLVCNAPFISSISEELSVPYAELISLNTVILRLASAISLSKDAILPSTDALASCKFCRAVFTLSACSAPPVVRLVILMLASEISS